MVELVACTDKHEWERHVMRFPKATVFHRLDWLNLVATISRSRLVTYLIAHHGETIGALPVFVFRRGLFRMVASPPPQSAAPVLGPLVEDALLGDVMNGFVREAKRLGASYCELRFEGDCPAAVLQTGRFEREPRSTFVLELTAGPETLWEKSFSAACRRAIRKAQAFQLTVEEGDLRACVDRYHALAAGVYAKHDRLPPLSRADYLAMADVAERSGMVKVLTVRAGREVIAAGIFPFGNGTVYYLDGVSDPAAHNMRPNNLLHWHLIRWACQEGLRRYDMVGAGIPGVARFKQGFGPIEVPYTYCFRTLGSVAALARASYAVLAPGARKLQHRLARLRLKKRPVGC